VKSIWDAAAAPRHGAGGLARAAVGGRRRPGVRLRQLFTTDDPTGQILAAWAQNS
jgi:hypothetical protein